MFQDLLALLHGTDKPGSLSKITKDPQSGDKASYKNILILMHNDHTCMTNQTILNPCACLAAGPLNFARFN